MEYFHIVVLSKWSEYRTTCFHLAYRKDSTLTQPTKSTVIKSCTWQPVYGIQSIRGFFQAYTVLRLELNFLPEQKLLVLMVLLEWSELTSHSFPSSSEKGESDRGEPLSFGRKGWRTKRGMRLRGLPFSGDFFSCSKQHLSELQAGIYVATHLNYKCAVFFRMTMNS